MDTITIIVPCFNEQSALSFFYKEYLKIAQLMNDITLKLLFIDDGSTDDTLTLIKEYAKQDSSVKYISFSRNFGKEAAIYAGLQHASGDYVVIMDADLQDPPSLLPELYAAVKTEGYDSAATRRISRKGEPLIRSWFARKFYKLMHKIAHTDLVDGARDYRLMNRKFVNALLSLGEYNRFTKGLYGWVGFKTKWIEFENIERIAGESKWSFWKLFYYAIEGIVAFSTVPLTIATVIGLICCFCAFSATSFIIIRKLIFDDPIQGWASTVSIILFIGGVQLLCTGILGQYLAKTYLETKKRPIYIIDKKNF